MIIIILIQWLSKCVLNEVNPSVSLESTFCVFPSGCVFFLVGPGFRVLFTGLASTFFQQKQF